MSERSEVTDKIIEYCQKEPDYFMRKIHCGAMQGRGLPDLWGSYHGMFVCCESKTPAGRLSRMQQHFIQLINKAGGCAFAARSLEEFVREVQDGYSRHCTVITKTAKEMEENVK